MVPLRPTHIDACRVLLETRVSELGSPRAERIHSLDVDQRSVRVLSSLQSDVRGKRVMGVGEGENSTAPVRAMRYACAEVPQHVRTHGPHVARAQLIHVTIIDKARVNSGVQ